ncbi:sensor histidine kinase [Coralliovum pocilloporae]|uniref:sensor histidine kinase n=1 Tax=Coralliovum pocilloporae TaxID=3066369 RepID=UPI003D9C4A59
MTEHRPSPLGFWHRFARGLARRMPKGLFGRSLLIVIMPMVILQSVLAFVFMERHWQTVTQRLSASLSQDIAAVIELADTFKEPEQQDKIVEIAAQRLGLNMAFLEEDTLPRTGPKPFFSLLDRALSAELGSRIGRPFWLDTVGRSNLVEIRVALDGRILQVFARRSQTYASNSHIFIVWMMGTALVLILVSILFLRNQIRPIQRLAEAAERFGKGRAVPRDFRPRGAREVRQASLAFIEMSRRIERQIDQRTTMLAGVSHDLRTILTRFKLQLALLGDNPEARDMEADVDEMQRMMEDYMAFAKGTAGEEPEDVNIAVLLSGLAGEVSHEGARVSLSFEGEPSVFLRPGAMKRCIGNLIRNAAKFADQVTVAGDHSGGWLTVIVDDNGPGISAEERDNVFKPFYRVDSARNQDIGGTGLGLTIARDAARGHGGDIQLSDSPAGGLRVTLRIPA